MYITVIFDLDGTLLDTIGDLAAASNYALEKMGLPVHTVDEYKYFVGNGIPKLIERMMPAGSAEADRQRAHELFSEYYGKHEIDRTSPYPGIPELLSEMKKNGMTALCCTNKDHVFAEKLLRGFFGDDLTEIVGAGRGFPHKPDPAAVDYLINKYSPKETPLYVGDSGVDMQTAVNAKVPCCGVLWGFRGRDELEQFSPRYIAENVSQLRDIIFKDGSR